MILFQLLVKKEGMAVYAVKCGLSPSATNDDLTDAFKKLGYSWMKDLVRVSEPEGKTKKYTRIYFKLAEPVEFEGKAYNEMSFADRAGKKDIENITISKIRTQEGAELIKIRVEYPQNKFPPGDQPDVLLINPFTGRVSYGVEIGGKVEWKPERDFTLGIAPREGKWATGATP